MFRNRPQVVAELWSEVLDTLEWRGRFARVVFVVPHGLHGRSLAAFRHALRPGWPRLALPGFRLLTCGTIYY